MKLEHVLSVLRQVAPEPLAEDWDQVGLHLAGTGKPVKKALLCIDLTPPVLAEAVEQQCQLIVAYHPPIFHPLKRLADRDWKERMLAEAVRNGLAVYSPHTALDAVRPGMNDWLCEGIGLGVPLPIVPKQPKRDEYKVVVFVPESHELQVRQAMSEFGGGQIGNYRECSFSVEGEGGFRALEGANPAIGEVGKRETVREKRLEMIVPGLRLGGVVRAIQDVHPYEEPAIDVIKLEPEPIEHRKKTGAGRIFPLDDGPLDAQTLAERVKKVLGTSQIKMADGGDLIRLVCVCVGAGGSLFEKYPGADAYITGEMQHHQVLDLYHKGKVVILAGHTNTERPFLKKYREAIVEKGGDKVEWMISEADVAPINVV